jgi:hypothetical protein
MNNAKSKLPAVKLLFLAVSKNPSKRWDRFAFSVIILEATAALFAARKDFYNSLCMRCMKASLINFLLHGAQFVGGS